MLNVNEMNGVQERKENGEERPENRSLGVAYAGAQGSRTQAGRGCPPAHGDASGRNVWGVNLQP